jgi:hypothetical protein
MASPRSGATPPAHPGRAQTPAPAGESGAVPPASLREPALDRPKTQAFLDGLVESLPAARMLLLVNYRLEYQHGWGTKTYYTQPRLDPLLPASAEAMLQSLLGDDASLEALKQRLIERTQGNPFFLEESVRTLVETQMLVGDQGAYRLAGELPSIQDCLPPLSCIGLWR